MRVLLGLSVAAAFIALPAGASAAADGIIVDPNSPSGKEYAIPLEQAIQEQGGTRATSSGEPSSLALSAPLFGRGIAPSSGAHGGRSNDRLGGRPQGIGPGGGPAVTTAGLGDPAASAAAGREKGSSASSRVTLGIPLVAVVGGGALLLFVRRRNRQQP